MEKIEEYNENGELIHFKKANGYEWWEERDLRNFKKTIHERLVGGYEIWREYDLYGRLLHEKNSDGEEYDYDLEGNCIYNKNYLGFEKWCRFDKNKREIYSRNSDNQEYWTEYRDDGKIYRRRHKDNSNDEEEIEYYDVWGRMFRQIKNKYNYRNEIKRCELINYCDGKVIEKLLEENLNGGPIHGYIKGACEAISLYDVCEELCNNQSYSVNITKDGELNENN